MRPSCSRTSMSRLTDSRRAKNSASVITGLRRPLSRPSRRRWRLASRRVEPRGVATSSARESSEREPELPPLRRRLRRREPEPPLSLLPEPLSFSDWPDLSAAPDSSLDFSPRFSPLPDPVDSSRPDLAAPRPPSLPAFLPSPPDLAWESLADPPFSDCWSPVRSSRESESAWLFPPPRPRRPRPPRRRRRRRPPSSPSLRKSFSASSREEESASCASESPDGRVDFSEALSEVLSAFLSEAPRDSFAEPDASFASDALF